MESHPLHGLRAEKTRRLIELRELGMPVREAAARVGLAVNTAYAYLADPDASTWRSKAARLAGTCENCGGPTTNRKKFRRCSTCSRTGPKRYWTRARIIDAIRAWALTYGEAPITSDWGGTGTAEQRARYRRLRRDERRIPSYQTVFDVFGSWNAAIKAAGYEPQPLGSARHHRRLSLGGRCGNGHLLTPENTYVSPDGFRHCRRCARIRKWQRKTGLLLLDVRRP